MTNIGYLMDDHDSYGLEYDPLAGFDEEYLSQLSEEELDYLIEYVKQARVARVNSLAGLGAMVAQSVILPL